MKDYSMEWPFIPEPGDFTLRKLDKIDSIPQNTVRTDPISMPRSLRVEIDYVITRKEHFQ